jgi:hypothetical protein
MTRTRKQHFIPPTRARSVAGFIRFCGCALTRTGAFMHNFKPIRPIFAAPFLVSTVASGAQTLIDVAFTGGSFLGGLVTAKTGFAATGQTGNDFWNTYVNYSGVLSNLAFVNGTAPGANLTVANTDGSYGNGASDPMYGIYVYNAWGNITVTVTNLVAGAYDLYLYGHGNEDNQNSLFQISVGSQSYGSEATTNGSGWLSSVWLEGVQYVEFTNVIVSSGEAITITVEPGSSQYAVLSGLQMATVNSSNCLIAVQPANQNVSRGSIATFGVVAEGASPIEYQWLFNDAKISGAINSSYNIANVGPTNVGNYSVIVSNPYDSVTSIVATLTITQSLIDVAFTSDSLTGKTGFAAAGVTTNDFWNTCMATTLSGASLGSGGLFNMQFTDRNTSSAAVTITNIESDDENGASDPMYGNYLYAYGDNIIVTVTNLVAGAYDFYLYGHGNEDNQNSLFQISVGSQSYGSEATTNGSGWPSSVWRPGVQYVEFTNVSVPTGGAATITVEPGASFYSVLSGLQILWYSGPFIVTPPENQQVAQGATASFSVQASGDPPLTYQWLFHSASISGATNNSYSVTNVQFANAGNYSVIVSNAFDSITANAAVLALFGLSFTNGSFEVPVITNGNDRYAAPGDNWLTGWSIGGTANEVFLVVGTLFLSGAADGQQWVLFDSQNSPPGGSLAQTFSTTPGETYLLTYAEAADIAPSVKGLRMTTLASDGTLLASNETTYTSDAGTEGYWTAVRTTFPARTTNTTVIFTDTSVPAYDMSVGLDAVSVIPLPEGGPPLIIVAPNQSVSVNQAVIVTNYAYSPNPPVSFILASNAPVGASISEDGVFTWVPTCEQGSTTNTITTWATDSSVPPISNSMTFSVVVGDCVEVSIGSSIVQAGQSACVPVTLVSTVGVTNLNFTVAAAPGFLTNWSVNSSDPSLATASVGLANASFPQFSFHAQDGQTLRGANVIGSICLDTLSGNSAFVPLRVSDISATASGNSPATNLMAQMGRLVVIGRQSLLETAISTNSILTLTLYGTSGMTYDLLSTTNLLDGDSWAMVGEVALTDLFQVITIGAATNQSQFYKAVRP